MASSTALISQVPSWSMACMLSPLHYWICPCIHIVGLLPLLPVPHSVCQQLLHESKDGGVDSSRGNVKGTCPKGWISKGDIDSQWFTSHIRHDVRGRQACFHQANLHDTVQFTMQRTLWTNVRSTEDYAEEEVPKVSLRLGLVSSRRSFSMQRSATSHHRFSLHSSRFSKGLFWDRCKLWGNCGQGVKFQWSGTRNSTSSTWVINSRRLIS